MNDVAVIGAGPAGLMAAERLARAGRTVVVFDRMPSAGRKFLLAGRSGLNLTHSEPAAAFLRRYGAAEGRLKPALAAFPPEALIAWCEELGQPVFTGSSGRVFPRAMKAAPLLRAWLRRLDALGVQFRARHRWLGWDAAGALRFATPEGELGVNPAWTVLALGGASWPRMGSDGGWVEVLRRKDVAVTPLRASNVGVRVDWSAPFLARFEGAPLKRVAVSLGGDTVRGELVVTRTGLEGGPVYALSAAIRSALDTSGEAVLHVDVRPDLDAAPLAARLARGRGSRSLSSFLRGAAGLSPVAVGIVQEALHAGADPAALAPLIKAVPVPVRGLAPIERAISSAGGIAWEEVDDALRLTRIPRLSVCGEMLDWDAPTGGYLLQACFSSGVLAADGVPAA